MSEFAERMSEVLAFQREQEEKMEQHQEALKVRIQNFIDLLDPDDLMTLRDMVHLAHCNPETGNHIDGLITGCLIFKHGRSWEGNDSPLHSMVNPPADPRVAVRKEEQNVERERAENMQKYNLIPDADGNYFKCKGCGKFYISLEDRMLREPGVKGCDGCQEKAKFG